MGKFDLFLLNEEKSYFGHKVGDVLTALQDLGNDMENLGSRQLARLAEEIVGQIRAIIHTHWDAKYAKHLKSLQKIGVAIQKTIEDRGDLKEVIPAAVQSLQDLSGELGVKVNALEAPEMPGEDVQMSDFQSTPQTQQQPNAPPDFPGPSGNELQM